MGRGGDTLIDELLADVARHGLSTADEGNPFEPKFIKALQELRRGEISGLEKLLSDSALREAFLEDSYYLSLLSAAALEAIPYGGGQASDFPSAFRLGLVAFHAESVSPGLIVGRKERGLHLRLTSTTKKLLCGLEFQTNDPKRDTNHLRGDFYEHVIVQNGGCHDCLQAAQKLPVQHPVRKAAEETREWSPLSSEHEQAIRRELAGIVERALTTQALVEAAGASAVTAEGIAANVTRRLDELLADEIVERYMAEDSHGAWKMLLSKNRHISPMKEINAATMKALKQTNEINLFPANRAFTRIVAAGLQDWRLKRSELEPRFLARTLEVCGARAAAIVIGQREELLAKKSVGSASLAAKLDIMDRILDINETRDSS